MSTSVIHPNTIQIRPSRLTGLVVGVAILSGVTTWSIGQVANEDHARSNSPAVLGDQAARRALDTPTSQRPASVLPQAYGDSVAALDAQQQAAIYGNVGLSEPVVQSVNAHSPELQTIGSPTAVTRDLVNRGLIPRQSLEPAPQSTGAKLHDLVNRGLIPGQTLEPAPQSVNAQLQHLVNQGLIPRQTLDR